MTMSDGSPISIDLFAGAGGLSLGLENAGFNVLAANEIHEDPSKTYRTNHPETNVITEDIRDIEASELLEAAEVSADEGLDEVDLIAGGPPCQGFSTAGDKDEDDPRNNLYKDFVRMVEEIQPRAFLMENVTGLASMYDGEALEEVLDLFDTLDYNYRYEKLNAINYGAPQLRKRLIFIGYQDGTAPQFPESACAPKSQLDGFTKPEPTSIGEAVSDLRFLGSGETADEYEIPPETAYQEVMRENADKLHNHVATNHSDRVINRFDKFPQGGDKWDIPEEFRTKKDGRKRWDATKHSRAITSSPDDFIHYERNRIPTVRETARIQTFPDDYEFKGQRTTGNWRRKFEYCSQTQQVGNAVPPWLGESVGREILKSLGHEPETESTFMRIRRMSEATA
jgi:DNA (cytosine-5)-methyltransferase 1